MPTAPNIVEIKTLLRDAISHGTVGKIANILGVTPGDISHRFDPNNPRKDIMAEGAREGWAIACADPAAWRIIKTYFILLFNSWDEPVPATDKGLSNLIGDAAQKLNDLQTARFIEGRSGHVQRDEALAVIAALQQFLSGLEQQLELKDSDASRFGKRAG